MTLQKPQTCESEIYNENIQRQAFLICNLLTTAVSTSSSILNHASVAVLTCCSGTAHTCLDEDQEQSIQLFNKE